MIAWRRDALSPARSDLRVRFSLSGVTPGEREELSIRRVSGAARCAEWLTQGETRWGIPPFSHAEPDALIGTRRLFSRRRAGRCPSHSTRPPRTRQIPALA